MSSWVVDVLFRILRIPRYFSASAACLADTCSCAVCSILSPHFTVSVGLSGMFTDDQFAHGCIGGFVSPLPGPGYHLAFEVSCQDTGV